MFGFFKKQVFEQKPIREKANPVAELSTLLSTVNLLRKEANPLNQALIAKLNQRIAKLKKIICPIEEN